MVPPLPHRKQVKHYDDPGQLRELTFSCYKQMPLLTKPKWLAMLAKSVDAATYRHGFDLAGFVFMPDHVHLLVAPRIKGIAVARLLYAIKRPLSYRIKMDLIARNDPLLIALTVKERPGKSSFRFWQEGPGYDRNLI